MKTSKVTRTTKGFVAAAAAAAIGLLSAAPASAEPAPPSYASGHTDQTIRGTIASIDGKYNISVRDTHGYLDNVELHQGTIINPTGLTLAPGMNVTIAGTNAGSAFAANEIDTPYTLVAAVPVYPGYLGYPYPYGWGYGYGYRVGIGFGRGFGFGFRG